MDKVRLLNVLLGVTFLLGFGFLIAAIVACNKCYVAPCFEGRGLDVLYKVSNGLGFEVVISGFIFCLHTGHGIRVLNKAQTGQSVQMGISIGLSIAATVLSLQNAVMWGSQALMVDDLDGTYDQSGRVSYVNTTTRSTFTAICALASMIFVADLAISALMYWWKDELLNEGGVETGYKDFSPEDAVGYGNAGGGGGSGGSGSASTEVGSYQGNDTTAK